MHWLWMGLEQAFGMFWQTLWALVIGFGISAALQVFVSKEQMARAFGATSLRSVVLAMLLGAASSSCSYAAVAAGRSAFQKGAALVPVLAFMFASTNLVIELGAMIWVLMGWQFVLAEAIGSLVLIGVMWLLARLFFPKELEQRARVHAAQAGEARGHCCDDEDSAGAVTSSSKLIRMAKAFVADWRMIWKELLIGFLVAGFLAALVPSSWWRALFLQEGPAWLRLVENAAVGPIIGIASWVCSCANIPLASLLWTNGITFGGVVSFIYADLIVVPIILIYWKYYGSRAALYITLIFYVSMVVAGIVVDLIFNIAGLVPSAVESSHAMMVHAVCEWNYTTWLNLAALIIAALLFYLSLRNRTSAGAH